MSQQIDHIAIVVRDIETALQVYQDALGLKLARIDEVPQEAVRVAFLPLPDGGEIELVQPTTADSGIARFLEKRGEGIHHLCLTVPDLEAARARMEARGLKPVEDQPRIGPKGQKYLFFHPKSTHGVLIELYETPTS